MDNVLFGRIGHNHPDGPERIRSIVREILDELGLYDDVLDVGLDFNVGVGGRRLTGAQRQKLDVARALLKRADFLIFNRPLLALDHASAGSDPAQCARGGKARRPYAGHHLGPAQPGDGEVVSTAFSSSIRGELVEDGTHETLQAGNGIFKELLA